MDYLGSLFKLRASLMVQWVKNLHANAGNTGHADSIPWLGRSPGGGNGNPLQYPGGKFTDRGVWRATAHGVTKSWT